MLWRLASEDQEGESGILEDVEGDAEQVSTWDDVDASMAELSGEFWRGKDTNNDSEGQVCDL